MPVTINEAKSNATSALDVQVIDEFRKESAVIDNLTLPASGTNGETVVGSGHERRKVAW